MSIKYPNLINSKYICFDIETYDPNLIKHGPGVYRKDGHVLGVSISDGNFSEYYSFAHEDSNQDHQKNKRYIQHLLSSPAPKIAANILYDMDWLQNGMGFEIKGPLHDVQMAEPLLDEYKYSYSLGSLIKEYTEHRKMTDLLQEWCDKNNEKAKDPRALIYKMDYETVRKYAKQDSFLLIPILEKQIAKLKEQDLYELYEMEMSLIPLLLQMKKIGVRIDTEGVKKKITMLEEKLDKERKDLFSKYGEVNVKSGKQIANILDKEGIEYPRNPLTPKMIEDGKTIGNPCLNKETLNTMRQYPFIQQILNIRSYRTLLDTFFINSFTGCEVNGRIHTMFHPLRNDDFGTVSGRFSSSNPNLQNIPSRDDTMGVFCREVFLPEETHVWAKLDWSQIEYRLIAHYARGEKSDYIREQYNNNPDTDYHQMIMNWTGLDRKEAKKLNFAMAYFMGVSACSKKFGWTMEEAADFVNTYHSTVPFVKETRSHVVSVAKRRGWLKTILGRRARISTKMIRDHSEFSLFNRLIQGSAADIMKKAMVVANRKGIFESVFPHLTVHDELDISVPKTKEGAEAVLELKNIMENCVKLKIPIIADLEMGLNWGNVNEEFSKKFLKEHLNAEK